MSELRYRVESEVDNDGNGRIWHVLVGPKGAVQFMALRLPENAAPWCADTGRMMGCDVGYHARAPQYEGHTAIDPKCPWTEGPCYYDGSSMRAMEWANTLYNLPAGEQEGWLRLALQEEYEAVFG